MSNSRQDKRSVYGIATEQGMDKCRDLKQCKSIRKAEDLPTTMHEASYIIAKLLFTQNSGHRKQRRKLATELISIFNMDYDCSIPDEMTNLDVLRVINSTIITPHDGTATLQRAIKNILVFLDIVEEGELMQIKTEASCIVVGKSSAFRIDLH